MEEEVEEEVVVEEVEEVEVEVEEVVEVEAHLPLSRPVEVTPALGRQGGAHRRCQQTPPRRSVSQSVSQSVSKQVCK